MIFLCKSEHFIQLLAIFLKIDPHHPHLHVHDGGVWKILPFFVDLDISFNSGKENLILKLTQTQGY